MIVVTDIVDLLIDQSTMQVFPSYHCPLHCEDVISTAMTTFNGVCGPDMWTLNNQPIDEARTAMIQDWLYTCLDRYGIHSDYGVLEMCCHAEFEHSIRCSQHLTWTMVFQHIPTFIVLQLYQDYAMTTRINLEVSVPMNVHLVTYRLGCIIYYMGNHFISRILSLGGQIFEYNG